MRDEQISILPAICESRNVSALRGTWGTVISAVILLAASGCPSPPDAPEPPAADRSELPEAGKPAVPAEKPQVIPSEPEPPPLVYQDSDGSLQLSPIVAQLIGPGLELDEYDHIRGFQNREQRAIWQAQITLPGTYRVEAETICTGPTREAKMRVHVGEKLFAEGFSQLSDHSMQVVTTPLGSVELRGPETYQVELEMTGLPLVGEFAVAGIRLVPMDATSSPAPRFMTEAPDGDQP